MTYKRGDSVEVCGYAGTSERHYWMPTSGTRAAVHVKGVGDVTVSLIPNLDSPYTAQPLIRDWQFPRPLSIQEMSSLKWRHIVGEVLDITCERAWRDSTHPAVKQREDQLRH